MGAQADQAAALVAEDNFMKASGDAVEFERAQKYAWETQERGDKNKLHLQANPTSGEYVRRTEREESEAKQKAQRKMLLEKYGGEQHLQITQGGASVVENERYVEYDPSGTVKGASKADAKSKYPEDVLTNNHSSVWGSWWANFQWGYACCHSTIKNSYCTGPEGKLAFEEAENMRTGGELESRPGSKAIQRDNERSATSAQHGEGLYLEDTSTSRDKVERVAKKRTLTEMKGGISEEELEYVPVAPIAASPSFSPLQNMAQGFHSRNIPYSSTAFRALEILTSYFDRAYKRSRAVADDPMAKLLGKDDLVH